jgi:hypothetical protein
LNITAVIPSRDAVKDTVTPSTIKKERYTGWVLYKMSQVVEKFARGVYSQNKLLYSRTSTTT